MLPPTTIRTASVKRDSTVQNRFLNLCLAMVPLFFCFKVQEVKLWIFFPLRYTC